MKGRKKILLLALFAVATLVFSACSKTQTNNDFSVGGTVITDAEFFEISIFVNGIKTDYSLDSSGCFNISHLKSGDVITFSKEGYSFNSYTVGGFSVDGIEIVGTKCRYDVLTFFDENYGTVSGAGKYEYGETATLTITPKEHFEIDGIYEKDNLVSSNSEYSFTVTDDHVFVVRFSKKKYPITIEKTDKACVVVAPESAVFGEEITVSASDDENFVFAYFEIDGTKYYDKTLNFTIKSENTKINAVFLKRLSKPEISFDGRSISVVKGENAESCEVFIDGEFLFNTTSDKTFSLADYNVSDGAHNVLVKVSGDGFGENESAININYVRPYDTPKNVGMLIEEDKVYFVFQQVLAASGYEIFMNGQKVETPLDKKASGGSILIRVDTLFTENGTYAFSVRATGDRPESEMSFAAEYTFKGTLSAPEKLTISADKKLSFSAVDGAASYDVVINGVSVLKSATKTEIELIDVLTSPINYEIKVRANGDNRLTFDSKFSTLSYDNVMQLGTPENVGITSVDGKVILSFDSVSYASGYEIDVNGEILKTTDNKYDLTDKVSVPADYTIKVRATGGKGYDAGEWATTTYEYRKTIESPRLLVENKTVSWAKSEGANEYSVVVTFMETEIEKVDRFSGTSFDLSELVAKHGAGEYAVKVQALSNGNYDYSDVTTIYYRNYLTLEAPTLTVNGTIVSWTKVENAVDYTIKIDGRIISTNVTAESFDVSPYVAEVKTYTIAVVANANGWYYESAEGTATFVKTGALSSPVPTASGSVVSWTKVLGATAYDVYVGGEKVLTVTDTTADISTYLQQGENKVKIVATAEGFSDGVSEEIVVIGDAIERVGLKTYRMIIENESDYIVFVDGQRTDKKIENGKITLPDTAEKMIIVPDITNLPEEGGYVMLFSEIDLTTATKNGEEYAVQGWIADSFDNTRLTIIGEGEGTNELGEHTVDGGNKVYYLNEKGKYRPKQPGEV